MRDPQNRVVLSFFVAAGMSATVNNVPDGEFRISFISAQRWTAPCGLADLIHPWRPVGSATAQEMNGLTSLFDAQGAKHLTFTLYTVRGGNTATRSLAPESFFR
jgi:hypothetical protein